MTDRDDGSRGRVRVDDSFRRLLGARKLGVTAAACARVPVVVDDLEVDRSATAGRLRHGRCELSTAP